MVINHNMSALFANRVLKFNNLGVDKDMEKLSSGLRINRAGDDASGLAVSEKMRAQIRGLRRALQNDHGRLSAGNTGHPATDPRAVCASLQRHLLAGGPDADTGRGLPTR